jgi:hypothetical protein
MMRSPHTMGDELPCRARPPSRPRSPWRTSDRDSWCPVTRPCPDGPRQRGQYLQPSPLSAIIATVVGTRGPARAGALLGQPGGDARHRRQRQNAGDGHAQDRRAPSAPSLPAGALTERRLEPATVRTMSRGGRLCQPDAARSASEPVEPTTRFRAAGCGTAHRVRIEHGRSLVNRKTGTATTVDKRGRIAKGGPLDLPRGRTEAERMVDGSTGAHRSIGSRGTTAWRSWPPRARADRVEAPWTCG